MKPEELKVGMWLTDSAFVFELKAMNQGTAYYDAWQRRRLHMSFGEPCEKLSKGKSFATAAEVREHVPEHLWPAWARDNLPNLDAAPQGDADGLFWHYLTYEDRKVWVTLGQDGPQVAVWKNGLVEKVNSTSTPINVSYLKWIPRPDWSTPAQLAEIKRLLGVADKKVKAIYPDPSGDEPAIVQYEDAAPTVESTPTPLPWDKPEELRTVDGRKIHHIYRDLSGDWMFDLGDDNPGPCLCDDFGRLRGTDIQIIRRATPAEMEAERPTPKVRPWTWETAPAGDLRILYRRGDKAHRRNAVFRPKHVTLYHSFGIDGNISYEDLVNYGTQLDGSPCGVVEGGGE